MDERGPPATLAEYGSTVVQLALHLSQADLGPVEAPNLVAFTVVGGFTGVLAATALWLAARAVDPRLSDALNGGVYDRTAYVLAAVVARAAGVLLLIWPLRRRCGASKWSPARWGGWSRLSLLLAAFLPDAAYVASWPLVAATIGFTVLSAREHSSRAALATAQWVALPQDLDQYTEQGPSAAGSQRSSRRRPSTSPARPSRPAPRRHPRPRPRPCARPR